MKNFLKICAVLLGLLLIQNVAFAGEVVPSGNEVVSSSNEVIMEIPKFTYPPNRTKIISSQQVFIEWE